MAIDGLPWRISNSEDDAFTMNGAKPVAILTADGRRVACNETYYPTAIDEDDAADIVHAVNSHDALVDALKAVKARGLPDRYASDIDLAEQVDAALVKAAEK